VHFERVRVDARGAGQRVDRQIDLIGDEKIEPEDVVRRLAGAPAIDPRPAAEFLPLPRFADRQPDEQRDECGEERRVSAHDGVVRTALGSLR
jgi:hypothetical protein